MNDEPKNYEHETSEELKLQLDDAIRTVEYYSEKFHLALERKNVLNKELKRREEGLSNEE